MEKVTLEDAHWKRSWVVGSSRFVATWSWNEIQYLGVSVSLGSLVGCCLFLQLTVLIYHLCRRRMFSPTLCLRQNHLPKSPRPKALPYWWKSALLYLKPASIRKKIIFKCQALLFLQHIPARSSCVAFTIVITPHSPPQTVMSICLLLVSCYFTRKNHFVISCKCFRLVRLLWTECESSRAMFGKPWRCFLRIVLVLWVGISFTHIL